MTTHTPGPWKTVLSASTRAVTTSNEAPKQATICRLFSECVAFETGEFEANARLIAAAPELLAALKMAIGSLLHLKKQSAHLGEDHAEHAADCMAFRAAYEAINKAEGRA
jgi:hypothetical protein